MSWRDADNPRCPECGEEISATASYCMHCYADLPSGETDADVSSADDVERTADRQDRSSVYDDSPDSEAHPSAARGDVSVSGSFGALPNPHSLDGLAGRVASMLWTEPPEGDDVSKGAFTAPLWMRVPVAFASGLVAFIVFLIPVLVLFNDLPVPGDGLLILVGFLGIMWWLVRKPLPSDIVGDACYGIALMLLSIPFALLINRLLRTAIGQGLSLETTGIYVVISLFVVMVPVALFLVLGYVGNRYARSKLDSKAADAADTTRA